MERRGWKGKRGVVGDMDEANGGEGEWRGEDKGLEGERGEG